MSKSKPIYEKPVVMDLGAVARGAGACLSGSVATVDGSCAGGGTVTTGGMIACQTGGTAAATCAGGFSATMGCANGPTNPPK